MEKSLFCHPIIVRDNTRGIAFQCMILNSCGEKIETLDALKAAMKSFGEEYQNLNVTGFLAGKPIISYYFEKGNADSEYRFRYYDASNKLISIAEPDWKPDYMFDGVNRIY